MSIVEKALKKLQASGGAPPVETRPGGAAASAGPSGQAARHEPAAGPDGSRAVPPARSSKLFHVDFDRLRHAGMIPPEHQQREISDQYRTIKRPLIRNAFDPQAQTGATGVASLRSIMVSSALPGDGKTFTSVNLALSLSLEQDHSVLLVDADIPKPHVSEALGLLNEPGLMDALVDPNLQVESLVLPTDVRGLSVLPVGHRSDTATELLASARMRQVIASLERLDPQGLVVVDSPPILLTSEARVLASLFGQVLLVVRAGVTPQQAVTDAIAVVGEGPKIGLVLNQAVHEGVGTGYYGYGYRYGGSASTARSDSASSALKAAPAAESP